MTPRIQQDTTAGEGCAVGEAHAALPRPGGGHCACRSPRFARLRRGRGDDGAALVEFALVSVLLFTLVFGIIVYGMSMSFRGTLQQSASEGARAAAAAPRNVTSGGTLRDNSVATTRAVTARDDALDGYGKACGSGEGDVTCNIDFHDCDAPDSTAVPADKVDTAADLVDCITVTLQYEDPYPVDIPLVPSLPLRASATIQLNDR